MKSFRERAGELIDSSLNLKLAVAYYSVVLDVYKVYLSELFNRDFELIYYNNILTYRYCNIELMHCTIPLDTYTRVETLVANLNQVTEMAINNINSTVCLIFRKLDKLDELINSKIVKFEQTTVTKLGEHTINCSNGLLIFSNCINIQFAEQIDNIVNFVSILESIPELDRNSILSNLSRENLTVNRFKFLVRYNNEYYMNRNLSTEYYDICNARTGEIPDKETYLKIKTKLNFMEVE